MKKINAILSTIIFLFFINTSCAQALDITTQAGLNKVNTIGKKVLSANKLPTKVTFDVVETDDVNAYASGDNTICVYTGLLKFVNDDSELAGVISHEVGHIVNNHVAKQSLTNAVTSTVIANANIDYRLKTGAQVAQNLSMKKMSRTEEYEADITGVDLMIKAGYNPLAMISVLYKISGNYIDLIQDHPSGDKRTMYLYDYITYTYPGKLKAGYNSDSYKQFVKYAQPIVEKRNSNPTALKKFNKEQEKLKAKRIEKLNKYKNSNNDSGWQASYTLLKSLSSLN